MNIKLYHLFFNKTNDDDGDISDIYNVITLYIV